MAKSKRDLDTESSYVTKKCPHCFTYIPLNALTCPSCKEKVGAVDKHGMASKGTDWRSYIIAFIACLVFVIYIYYAFIK
jgi:hypothetical protein